MAAMIVKNVLKSLHILLNILILDQSKVSNYCSLWYYYRIANLGNHIPYIIVHNRYNVLDV